MEKVEEKYFIFERPVSKIYGNKVKLVAHEVRIMLSRIVQLYENTILLIFAGLQFVFQSVLRHCLVQPRFCQYISLIRCDTIRLIAIRCNSFTCRIIGSVTVEWKARKYKGCPRGTVEGKIVRCQKFICLSYIIA